MGMSREARVEFTSPTRFSYMDVVPIDAFLAMLLIDGMMNAADWQCKAVLVASEEEGRVPRYFNCCKEDGHSDRMHECGNGSEWWHEHGELRFEGTLYDPQTDNVVRKSESGHLGMFPAEGHTRGDWDVTAAYSERLG